MTAIVTNRAADDAIVEGDHNTLALALKAAQVLASSTTDSWLISGIEVSA